MSERNKFTRKLLLESGIKEGWRILDVGCGSGEVSLLASELINGKGEIIGIDVNAASIQIAQTRAAEENVTNVQFVAMPIENAAKELGTFDLIIGRRILMYLPNLFQAIEALTKILKSNGRMVFQESDAMVAETSATTFPLHTKAQQYVWQTVA
ncbi:MAG: class I SAM-dependent methyltransferase, partial [Enterococcus sp.]|nr:class I SAM-dependent methyltransferase [Enterococcus sp.]